MTDCIVLYAQNRGVLLAGEGCQYRQKSTSCFIWLCIFMGALYSV